MNAKLSRYVCEKKRIRRNTRIHELENKINLNRDEEKEIRLIFKLVRLNGKTYNQYALKVYSSFIKIVKRKSRGGQRQNKTGIKIIINNFKREARAEKINLKIPKKDWNTKIKPNRGE